MQVTLADFIKGTPDGEQAEAILHKCVHCGFCTATCPTYQLLGDELDGPRGRIYLIKEVLEGVEPTASTQLHLDRCLTCLNCETTCPSGVQFGRLIDIGRHVVDAKVPRSALARTWRTLIKELLAGPLFAPALWLGRALRPLLPGRLRNKVLPRRSDGPWPSRRHQRRMLLLAGCVQPSMMPNINAATARVFDTLGIELIVPAAAGCCGAIRHHMNDQPGALDDVRRNIDAWWPHIESGAEAIIMNASGCGAMVRQYGYLLRNDAAYAGKAARVSELSRDLAELLPPLLAPRLAAQRSERDGAAAPPRIAFHPPCSLQHAQSLRGVVEPLLSALGAQVLPFKDSHLCCGSAGTYSVLQPQLANALRERKLEALMEARPDTILSANVGCIAHLAANSPVPVRHWVEWLDVRLATEPLNPTELVQHQEQHHQREQE
jgi:glycolate oxidase iron-sulfur subunit